MDDNNNYLKSFLLWSEVQLLLVLQYNSLMYVFGDVDVNKFVGWLVLQFYKFVVYVIMYYV